MSTSKQVAVGVLLIAVGLSGCATITAAGSAGLTDERIASATATVLGYTSGTEVRISDRRTEGNVNRYVATTRSGRFVCSIIGGGALVGFQVSSPECHPAAAN